MTALAERNSWAAEGVDDLLKFSRKASQEEPQLVRTLRGHRGAVHGVAFSPTRRQLASTGGDGAVMLWSFGMRDEATRRERPTRAYRFEGHDGAVYCAAFRRDGRQLATGGADRTVRLWETRARGESRILRGHSGAVRAVAFSPDGTRLLTGADDKCVKVWSLPRRQFVCTLGASELAPPSGARPARRARHGGGGAVASHANWVRAACWSPDGTVAASGGDDKLVKVWDVEAAKATATFFEHEKAVRGVCFSADGTCVVACGDDAAINVWDTRTKGLLQHYTAHTGPCTSVAVDPKQAGRYLASTGADGTVKLYYLRQGQLLYTLEGHAGGAAACAFSGMSTKGELLASGGADKTVMVWRSQLDGCGPAPAPKAPAKAPAPSRAPIAAAAPPKPPPAPPAKGVPEVVAKTLDHVVGQLDAITSTLGALEKRICANEGRVATILEKQ